MTRRRAILIAAFLGYLVMACLPLALAFYSEQGRSLAQRPFWDDVASGIAMIGFAVILMEFMLLGRFRTLSASLGSDFLMQAHQLLARTALVFMLLHPFFYSLWGDAHKAHDLSYAAALKIDGLSLLTGVIAWVLLLSLVFSATKRESYDYDRWRGWHALLAVLLAGFGVHHALDAGRYSAFTPLSIIWWLLIILATLAVITVYIIRPAMQKHRAFSVKSIRPVAKDIHELIIESNQRQRFRFKPGQFVWVKIESLSVTHDHPFSIASGDTTSARLRFLIKAVGDFTASVAQTPIGTLIYLDGPHGHFQIPKKATAVIMIAGGIGIAPFCGLLEHACRARDRRPMRLIYGNRLAAQAINVNELANTGMLSDFKQINVISEPQVGEDGIAGQLDARVLAEILARPDMAAIGDRAVFMVCGPAVMIDAVETSLVKLGVPLSRIISEKFQYDFDLRAPRSRRTLLVWLMASGLLLAAALAGALR